MIKVLLNDGEEYIHTFDNFRFDEIYFRSNIEPIIYKFNGYVVGNLRVKYIRDLPNDMLLKLKKINIELLKTSLVYEDLYIIDVLIEVNKKAYKPVEAIEKEVISLEDFNYIQNYIYRTYKDEVKKDMLKVYFNDIRQYNLFKEYTTKNLGIKVGLFDY